MRRYVPPILKGKKIEKDEPKVKLKENGQLDFSENFAIKLHTRREDDYPSKPITRKKIKEDLHQLMQDKQTTWEVFITAEELKKRKEASVNASADIIKKNIEQVQDYSKGGIKEMIKQVKNQSKGHQIQMAQTKNDQIAKDGRQKVQNFMNRWDAFRDQREVLIDRYIHLRKRQECAYYNLKLAICINSLKKFVKFYREEALRVKARNEINRQMKKGIVRYRNRVKKFGETRADRQLNHIRQILTF
jgi:hypothetical protein